jgi:hypothetical protein
MLTFNSAQGSRQHLEGHLVSMPSVTLSHNTGVSPRRRRLRCEAPKPVDALVTTRKLCHSGQKRPRGNTAGARGTPRFGVESSGPSGFASDCSTPGDAQFKGVSITAPGVR